jgi:hypothetical protein
MRWAGHEKRERQEYLKGRDYLEGNDTERLDLRKNRYEIVGWIQLANARVHWWPLLKVVLNLGLHKTQGISWRAEQLSTFHKEV